MIEGLEFFLGNKDVGFVFYLTLVLLPAEQNGVFQESGRKQNLVWLRNTSGGKKILALLKEL